MKEDRQDFQEMYAEYYPKIAGYLQRLVGRLALKKSMNRACTFYRDERNELSCDRKPTLQFRKK